MVKFLEGLEILKLSKKKVRKFIRPFDMRSRIVKGNLSCCLEKINDFAGFYRVNGNFLYREEPNLRKEYGVAEIVLPIVSLEEAIEIGLVPYKLFGVDLQGLGGNLKVQIKYQNSSELAMIFCKEKGIYCVEQSVEGGIERVSVQPRKLKT
tara:strand:+ start:1142 stop:1594 length:453 start_codon:yes stop_codon:yes gene_type:complete